LGSVGRKLAWPPMPVENLRLGGEEEVVVGWWVEVGEDVECDEGGEVVVVDVELPAPPLPKWVR
jgi:hypothetical protein